MNTRFDVPITGVVEDSDIMRISVTKKNRGDLILMEYLKRSENWKKIFLWAMIILNWVLENRIFVSHLFLLPYNKGKNRKNGNLNFCIKISSLI
jgi:hypothetical protein